MNTTPITPRIGFSSFYRDHFLPEQLHPINVAMPVGATLASAAYLVAAAVSPWPWPWLALLYPVVHAAPGLLGHRLFERNAAVGDLRVLRRDFPGWWFIVANHRMTFEWLWSLLRIRQREA